MKRTIVATVVAMASLVSFKSHLLASDKVKNGADRVEADFALALEFLPEMITETSRHSRALKLTIDQQRVLETLERALHEKAPEPSMLVFIDDMTDSENCLIEEQSKIACTTNTPGDPIYLNRSLFYRKDFRGIQVPLISFASAVQILVHELGHQYGFIGPKSHQSLDVLGAKVASVASKVFSKDSDSFNARSSEKISSESFKIEITAGHTYRGINRCTADFGETTNKSELCETHIQFMANESSNSSPVGTVQYFETKINSRITKNWTGIYTQTGSLTELTNGSTKQTFYLLHSGNVLVRAHDENLSDQVLYREDDFTASVAGHEYEGILFCREVTAMPSPEWENSTFNALPDLCSIKMTFRTDGKVLIRTANSFPGSPASEVLESSTGQFWQVGGYITYLAQLNNRQDDSDQLRHVQLSANGARLLTHTGGILQDSITKTAVSSVSISGKTFEGTIPCANGGIFISNEFIQKECYFKVELSRQSSDELADLPKTFNSRSESFVHGYRARFTYIPVGFHESFVFDGLYSYAGSTLLLWLPHPEMSKDVERFGSLTKYNFSLRNGKIRYLTYRLMDEATLIGVVGHALQSCTNCNPLH